MADTVASLGLVVDPSGVTAGLAALDKLPGAAARAQQQIEALARTSASAAQASRDQANALIQETQATIGNIQAKIRVQGQAYVNADTSRKESLALANLAQLDKYLAELETNLAQQTRNLTTAQDAATVSIQRYGQERAKTNAIMEQAASLAQTNINQQLGVQQYQVNPRTIGANNPSVLLGGGQSFNYDEQAKGMAQFEGELDKVRAKYNPLYAASKRYEQAVNEINRAQGAFGSQHEYETALETERLSFEKASLAAGGLAMGHQAIDTHAMAAFHSVRSMVEGMAMGVPVTQIFAQQIGQASYALSGPQGLMGAVNGITTLLGRLFSSTIVAGAGFVALVGGIAFLIYKAVSDQKELEKALLGTGRAAGVSSAQLNDMAISAAHSSNIGISTARKYAEEYAASGKIVGDQIRQLTALTEDYATTTRQTGAEGAKQLTHDFSDLTTGIDDLNSHLNFLDAKTREHIITLENQGEHSKAVAAAIDAMKPSLANHEEQLTLVGRAWKNIADFAGDALAASEKYLNRGQPSTQDEYNAAKANASLPVGALQQNNAPGSINWLLGRGHVVSQEFHDEAVREMRLFGQVLSDEAARAGKQTKDELLKGLSLKADEVSTALTPGLSGIKDALAEQARLQKELSDPAAVAMLSPDQKANHQQALAAVNEQLHSQESVTGAIHEQGKAYESTEQKALRSMGIILDATGDVNGAQKAHTATVQKLNETQGKAIDPALRMAQVAMAGKIAYAQWSLTIENQAKATDNATESAIKQANAYLTHDIPALVATKAYYQALTESITSGVDVGTRATALRNQEVAQQVQSAAQLYDTQNKLSEAQGKALDDVFAGRESYDHLDDAVREYQQTQERSILLALVQSTHNKALIADVEELIKKTPELNDLERDFNANRTALGALNPYASDIAELAKLNDLLKTTVISQNDFNAARSHIGIHTDLLNMQQNIGEQNPFGTGADAFMNSYLKQAEDQWAQWKKINDDAFKANEESWKQHEDNLVAINAIANAKISHGAEQLAITQLHFGEVAFQGLAQGVGDLLGITSGAYQAIFRIAKGFALAQAILNEEIAISNAMALPWPYNIPAIAQAVAGFGTIMSDIAGIVYAGQSHAAGAVGIEGPGSAYSDSIGVRISRGESIMSAMATRNNRNTLSQMNRGASFDNMTKSGSGDWPSKIVIQHDGSTRVRWVGVTQDEAKLIAETAVVEKAPGVVAADQLNPNGRMAQATRRTINAGRKRD